MTVTNVACYLGIKAEPVLVLRVDHTAVRLRSRNRLDGDPHLRMLWQVWQRGEEPQDAGLIVGFYCHAHPSLHLLRSNRGAPPPRHASMRHAGHLLRKIGVRLAFSWLIDRFPKPRSRHHDLTSRKAVGSAQTAP